VTGVRTVRQAVFVEPAVVVVARHRGLFEAEGVEVLTTTIPSSHAQWQELADGRADVAITATDNLFAWNAAGSDLAVIAQIETTTHLALVLRPGLASLRDVDVVRLAVDAPTNGFAIVAYAMMARLGLSRGRFEVIEVGGVSERFDALKEGAVDATLLAPPLDEMGQDLGMIVAMRVQELAPDYPGLGVVASRSRLTSTIDAIAAYLRALDAANTWMRESSQETVAQQLADAGFGRSGLAAVLGSVPSTLQPAQKGLELLATLRTEQGLAVADAPPAPDLVDLRPLAATGLVPVS
jgi:ABC-type nitrate/sulfonate/bicarbonate transport system substrate-binding protein